MPVTVVQDKGGATVVTIASGLYSVLLPLCQTLSGLCYGPVCRSVQEGLMQPTAILALGVRERFLILIRRLEGYFSVKQLCGLLYRLFRSWWVCSTSAWERRTPTIWLPLSLLWELDSGWVLWSVVNNS